MNPQQLVAGAAAVMLLLAVAWWQTSDPQVAVPGKPTYNGPVTRGVQVDVPQLQPFEAFNVNPAVPFVPYNQWRRVVDLDNKPPVKIKVPTPPTLVKPPWPSVVVNEPVPKPVVLPTLSPAAATAPQCIGLIGGEDAQLLVVRMPGADATVTLKIGAAVDGWTLVAIDNSNQAHFTDPSGVAQVFPIGDGDLAVAQTLVNPASDAPSKPNKPGEGALIKDLLGVPKPNQGQNQNGQNNQPKKPRRGGGQGGQGGQGGGQGMGQGAGTPSQ